MPNVDTGSLADALAEEGIGGTEETRVLHRHNPDLAQGNNIKFTTAHLYSIMLDREGKSNSPQTEQGSGNHSITSHRVPGEHHVNKH